VRVGVREGGVAAVCVGVQDDGVAERVWRVRARTVVAADVLGSGRDGRLCAYVGARVWAAVVRCRGGGHVTAPRPRAGA
jgi:hypothetical protein